MSFNNKGGPMSWLGSGSVQHHHHVERVNQTVNGKGAGYWFGYSQGLQERLEDLQAQFDNLQQQMAAVIEDRDGLHKIALERRANDAGLRAVIRYLLTELRKTNPNHPLLDKKVRDRIFDEFHKEEMDKALKTNDMQPWSPPLRPDEKQSP